MAAALPLLATVIPAISGNKTSTGGATTSPNPISNITGMLGGLMGSKSTYVKYIDPHGFFQKQSDCIAGIINVDQKAYAAATSPSATRTTMVAALGALTKSSIYGANLADLYYAGQTSRLKIANPLGPVSATNSNPADMSPVTSASTIPNSTLNTLTGLSNNKLFLVVGGIALIGIIIFLIKV